MINLAKKRWFYISVIQSGILILITVFTLISAFKTQTYQERNLKAYIDQFAEENNYFSYNGYIPDAKTAKIIGSQIIDKMTGGNRYEISGMTVEYDPENRLWMVSKEYLNGRHGGFVIMEQDSGKVVKALLTK